MKLNRVRLAALGAAVLTVATSAAITAPAQAEKGRRVCVYTDELSGDYEYDNPRDKNSKLHGAGKLSLVLDYTKYYGCPVIDGKKWTEAFNKPLSYAADKTPKFTCELFQKDYLNNRNPLPGGDKDVCVNMDNDFVYGFLLLDSGEIVWWEYNRYTAYQNG